MDEAKLGDEAQWRSPTTTGRPRPMAKRKTRAPGDVNTLLEEMLVDAYGDDEQLWALREGISAG